MTAEYYPPTPQECAEQAVREYFRSCVRVSSSAGLVSALPDAIGRLAAAACTASRDAATTQAIHVAALVMRLAIQGDPQTAHLREAYEASTATEPEPEPSDVDRLRQAIVNAQAAILHAHGRLGAPGDYGYHTDRGQALAKLYDTYNTHLATCRQPADKEALRQPAADLGHALSGVLDAWPETADTMETHHALRHLASAAHELHRARNAVYDQGEEAQA